MLPRVPFACALVEVDARTGFCDHLVHAGGKVTRPAELTRNLIYVIVAGAANMGLTAMAESCGVPDDVLAWTAEWYFRPRDPHPSRGMRELPPDGRAHVVPHRAHRRPQPRHSRSGPAVPTRER